MLRTQDTCFSGSLNFSKLHLDLLRLSKSFCVESISHRQELNWPSPNNDSLFPMLLKTLRTQVGINRSKRNKATRSFYGLRVKSDQNVKIFRYCRLNIVECGHGATNRITADDTGRLHLANDLKCLLHPHDMSFPSNV